VACIPWISFKQWDILVAYEDGGKACRRTQQSLQMPWRCVGTSFDFSAANYSNSSFLWDRQTSTPKIYKFTSPIFLMCCVFTCIIRLRSCFKSI
jgi:hypothetical protein